LMFNLTWTTVEQRMARQLIIIYYLGNKRAAKYQRAAK